MIWHLKQNLEFKLNVLNIKGIITCCGLWSNDIGIAFPFLSHITPLESPTFATNNVLLSIKTISAVLPKVYENK